MDGSADNRDAPRKLRRQVFGKRIEFAECAWCLEVGESRKAVVFPEVDPEMPALGRSFVPGLQELRYLHGAVGGLPYFIPADAKNQARRQSRLKELPSVRFSLRPASQNKNQVAARGSIVRRQETRE